MSTTGEFDPDFTPSYSTCDQVSPRCPVELTLYGDYFNLGACIFFTVSFLVLLTAQGWLARKSRAWSFASYLAVGTSFELLGYVCRIVLHSNPWSYAPFVIQLLFLILGPTLVAAAISVTAKHLVIYFGPGGSLIRPRWYPWVFVGSDFASIFIQAVGASIAGIATAGEEPDEALQDASSALLVAGVSFQLANMAFCAALMVVYWIRLRRRTKADAGAGAANAIPSEGLFSRLRNDKVFLFIVSLSVAYIAIVIRCIYRVPEMASGWASDLMQSEATFLIFDGTMILVAVLLLTVFHPCNFFAPMGAQARGEVPHADNTVPLDSR
ncbi:hypothetical protein NLU13_4208 [Sarocladium strictum]|uniref:Uncharacterized protein n=1 Tax=Sarocladium strictum TaxID=5046 RepID=A0AA39L8P6_SARSR|nr:hypothetical protein NLU13_4208 [Sarocladium strictum]